MEIAWLPDDEGDKILAIDLPPGKRDKIRKFLVSECRLLEYLIEDTRTGIRIQIVGDRQANGGWPVQLPSADFVRGYITGICEE